MSEDPRRTSENVVESVNGGICEVEELLKVGYRSELGNEKVVIGQNVGCLRLIESRICRYYV